MMNQTTAESTDGFGVSIKCDLCSCFWPWSYLRWFWVDHQGALCCQQHHMNEVIFDVGACLQHVHTHISTFLNNRRHAVPDQHHVPSKSHRVLKATGQLEVCTYRIWRAEILSLSTSCALLKSDSMFCVSLLWAALSSVSSRSCLFTTSCSWALRRQQNSRLRSWDGRCRRSNAQMVQRGQKQSSKPDETGLTRTAAGSSPSSFWRNDHLKQPEK